MNKSALKKNEWSTAKIRPIAKRFYGENGPQLPPVDDDWLIQNVDDDGVRISNPHTGHWTILGFDQIHHRTTDPTRGPGYGSLTLNIQLCIGGNSLWSEPAIRPGQSLPDQFEGVRGWQRKDDPAYIQSLCRNADSAPAQSTSPNWGLILTTALLVGVGLWMVGEA
jgi:hypothetical protein